MPPEAIFAELTRLAERLGLEVRAERFDLRVLEGRGGLCRLRGRPVVVMDAGLSVMDKIGVMAMALAELDVAPIYLPPVIRAKLTRAARRGC